jgi:hypothetical protein
MPEPQLSIRSARARSLAHKLAKKERRTVSQVVERALEIYARAQSPAPKETAAHFWGRLGRDFGAEHDLDTILQEHRKPHAGPKL